MSEPSIAQKDPAVVLSEALAVYKGETGVTLAPADPRRLHLQAFLLLLAQQRALIDFAGKQSLLPYVSDLLIDALGTLWRDPRIAAVASRVTLRFNAGIPGVLVVPAGKRATNGTHTWAVIATTTSGPGAAFVDALAQCTVAGDQSNAVAIGQIDTLVDPVSGIAGVSNTTASAGGRNLEQLEPYRERLRSAPEASSTCGPRTAYRAHALAAAPEVADAVALGADDNGFTSQAAPAPGEVRIVVIEGTRDADGVLVSVVPEPTTGVLDTVEAAVTDETVRPLTDSVAVVAAEFSNYDVDGTYYISRSRSDFVAEIQAAVEAAHAAYTLWQGSVIGRDINPQKFIADAIAAGAKRVVMTEPVYTPLFRDQCARLVYDTLVFGGIEDD